MSSNLKIEKLCLHCGNPFIARTLVTKYCSKRCNAHHYKKAKRDEVVSNAVQTFERQANPTLAPNRDYLDVKEAADLMRISRRTLYRLLADNEIPKRKVRSRTMILRTDIQRFFLEH